MFVKQIENFNRYPNLLIAKHIDEASTTHIQHVNEHIKKLENIRQAEEKAEQDKQQAKIQRKLERERKRELERIELLRK